MTSPTRRRGVVLAAAAALAASTLLPTTPADARAADGPTVLARHLVAPLSLALNREEAAYVSQNFGGPIVQIQSGHPTTAVYGVKQAELGGLSRHRGHLVFTVTGNSTPTEAASSVKWIRGGEVERLGNLGRAETNRNPDGDVEYGFADLAPGCADQLDPETFGPATHTGVIESHPYGSAAIGDTVYVADAAANVVWSVTDHKVRALSVLPPLPGEVTQDIAGQFGLPNCTVGETVLNEPVPTDVEVGEDGMLYVSTLAGEFPGAGAVFAIDPSSGATEQVVGGLSDTTGLALARNGDIYVAQLFAGVVLKIPAGGGEPEVFAEVNQPAALEIARGGLYATVNVLSGLGFKQRQVPFAPRRGTRVDGPNGKLVRWQL